LPVQKIFDSLLLDTQCDENKYILSGFNIQLF